MGRIRTIKPEFFTDEELSAVSEATHLFAASLLCYADDEGYFNANLKLLKAAIFPIREPSVSIHGMLSELSDIGFIALGDTSDGKRWGRVVKFSTHQRVNRPTPSKIKALSIAWEGSMTAHAQLTEDSLPEGKGTEGNVRASAPPPISIHVTDGIAADWEAEEESNIPDDLPAPSLGNFMLQRLGIPHSPSLALKFADAAALLARELNCPRGKAAAIVLQRARDNPPADGKWRFWLEDGGWKQQGVSTEGWES